MESNAFPALQMQSISYNTQIMSGLASRPFLIFQKATIQ